jgi:hypothetical protein
VRNVNCFQTLPIHLEAKRVRSPTHVVVSVVTRFADPRLIRLTDNL